MHPTLFLQHRTASLYICFVGPSLSKHHPHKQSGYHQHSHYSSKTLIPNTVHRIPKHTSKTHHLRTSFQYCTFCTVQYKSIQTASATEKHPPNQVKPAHLPLPVTHTPFFPSKPGQKAELGKQKSHKRSYEDRRLHQNDHNRAEGAGLLSSSPSEHSG